MYSAQHRGIPPNRLNELFDQLRQEFDGQSRNSDHYENQINAQIQEMEQIKAKVFQMEQAQNRMKTDYEDQIKGLRQELDNARSGMPSHMGGQPYGSSSRPQPPHLAHGPTTLFSGIMANSGQGGPGLAPPPTQDHQQQPPPQHPLQPISGPQQPGPLPPGGAQGPFQPYQTGPPTVNGYGPQPPQPTNSPGMNKNRPSNRGPPGPGTPQQGQLSYPDPRASPQIGRSGGGPNGHPFRSYGNELANIDPNEAPDQLKRLGVDHEWFAVFNPDVPRVLDVNLVHNLAHSSVVCCVRFSYDGRYVATGCNRSAQIYDVNTGHEVSVLQDENASKEGDLYIRSVCFSPDGKLLATGAEDKLIRVWDIQTKTIRNIFAGHDQDIYSLDFARNGRHIASGSGDKTVRLWDIDVSQQVLVLSIEDGVTTVAISPDGRYVAAGSLDKSVRVWDSTSGYLVERLEGGDGAEGHKDSVYSVAFSPDGNQLVSGSLDKTIKMWELTQSKGLLPGNGPKGGKCIRTFVGHKDYVLSVCLTPHGEWVMSGSKDRGVQFWDPSTGVAHMMLQGHKNSVISVAPSPTGGLFATGSGDKEARIWSYGPWQPDRR